MSQFFTCAGCGRHRLMIECVENDGAGGSIAVSARTTNPTSQ